MSQQYKNPYWLNTHDSNFYNRQDVLRDLDSLLNSDYCVNPTNVCVTAERGMGSKAVVQHFLKSRAPQLQVRIIECDVKTDLQKGSCAVDFYRALVNMTTKSLESIPKAALELAKRIVSTMSTEWTDILYDFNDFFRLIHEYEQERPLLFVFYYFDRLPNYFPFKATDWALLRTLGEAKEGQVFYLVVSRRPIEYLERLHGIDQSKFASIFHGRIRLGLLTEAEAIRFITNPAQMVVQTIPWPDELEQNILRLGGGNPYCLQRICFYLFNKLWNQRVALNDNEELFTDLYIDLRPYFSRLYRGLKEGLLLDAVEHAVNRGYSVSLHKEIETLGELGYFTIPMPVQHKYQLFSPLFDFYLVERGILPAMVDSGLATVRVKQASIPAKLTPIPTCSEVDLLGDLTPRQREVLTLLSQGKRNSELADSLCVSIHTVREHLKQIYSKLDVKNRTEAVIKARKLGLSDADDAPSENPLS